MGRAVLRTAGSASFTQDHIYKRIQLFFGIVMDDQRTAFSAVVQPYPRSQALAQPVFKVLQFRAPGWMGRGEGALTGDLADELLRLADVQLSLQHG
jgi:hypothetical protein